MPDQIIYALVDPHTHELRYIGMTTQKMSKRLRQHRNESIRHRSLHRLQWVASLLKANLKPEAVVLETAPADWREAEQFWIAYWRSLGCRLTNLCAGGRGIVGYKWSDEGKSRLKNRPSPSPTTREKIRQAGKERARGGIAWMLPRKGQARPLAWETARQAGHKQWIASRKETFPGLWSDEQRAKISATLKGRPLSAAHKAKLSAAKIGKPLSVEHRATLSLVKKQKLTYNARSVIADGIKFDRQIDCAKAYNRSAAWVILQIRAGRFSRA